MNPFDIFPKKQFEKRYDIVCIKECVQTGPTPYKIGERHRSMSVAGGYTESQARNALILVRNMPNGDCFEIAEHIPKYKIVCIKDCYAGQGIDYQDGIIYAGSLSREQALETLKLINENPSMNGCFLIEVDKWA